MEVRQIGEAVFLAPKTKEIGADIADSFKAEALAALPEGGAKVLMDLSEVEFMDSSGLSSLVAIMKRTRPGGRLVLFGLRPGVEEILRLTRLDAVFQIRRSEAEALAALGEDGDAVRRTA